MTVLNTVQSNARQFVQAWADAVQGFGGILTAPLATNRNTVGATKNAAKSAAKETYSAVLDGMVVIPGLAILHYYRTDNSGKSVPRRIGEGFSLGGLVYFLIYLFRGWMP